jgi:hypothetical protein
MGTALVGNNISIFVVASLFFTDWIIPVHRPGGQLYYWLCKRFKTWNVVFTVQPNESLLLLLL